MVVYMQNNRFTKYVSMWGNAISIADRKPENYAKDLTLRYPIKPMLSGDRLKLTFDNFCGTEPVTISSVYVADMASESNTPEGAFKGTQIVDNSTKAVTFCGKTSVTIHAGEAVVSDEIEYAVTRGKDICVSMYFGDFTLMRSAVLITGPLSKGFYAVGDYAAGKDLPLDYTRNTSWFYFLSNIEVRTEENARAVVCFGDSITSQAWPDYLTLRVEKNADNKTAIVRRAASGTRILRQYDNITYDSYGLKGSIRFPREALVSGADTVIIQQGINDIIHPVGVEVNPFRPWSDLPTAEEMIEGYRMYIEKAREYGLKVYMGTLLPIYGWRTYEPFRDDLRNALNDWMRTTKEIDGVIDFDKALQDPEKPDYFLPEYDSGDHLHPSKLGYERMAAEIPAEILK